ncbi:MAG: lipid II flippase MurJ, partial [Sulfurimonas sp.]
IKDEAKGFKKQFLPAIWGNSSAQVNAFVDTWLASFLATGSISYLYYANRIFQLPLALFAIATSIALFPAIARFIKNKDEQKALIYLKKAFWFLAFLLGFSTIGALILSEQIVKLLFERGAFSAKDTANSAFVLQMYMIGLLPFGLQKLISLWLYSKELQMRAAKIATFTLITNVSLSLLLIAPLGAAGLALATTLSGLVGFYQSAKVFGVDNFLFVLKDKKTPIFLISMVVFATILYYLKDIISVYI